MHNARPGIGSSTLYYFLSPCLKRVLFSLAASAGPGIYKKCKVWRHFFKFLSEL